MHLIHGFFLHHAIFLLLFFLLSDMWIPPLDGAIQRRRSDHLPLWWSGRISDGASVCHFCHPVHALVDVVSGLEGSTDGPRAGLDWRD